MRRATWIFFTDLFGEQRWLCVDVRGATLAESSRGFVDRHDCIANARQHGYAESEVPPTDGRVDHPQLG